MEEKGYRKNKWTFGLGTIGRDMVYSLISMYLLVYLTEVVNLSDSVLAGISVIILCARVFDALNDPIMGVIVDNTRTRGANSSRGYCSAR
jgi:melibiose permease/lactose/raffinose/galactose permease